MRRKGQETANGSLRPIRILRIPPLEKVLSSINHIPISCYLTCAFIVLHAEVMLRQSPPINLAALNANNKNNVHVYLRKEKTVLNKCFVLTISESAKWCFTN